jgi:GTP1/Obg family GTP-binding protein
MVGLPGLGKSSMVAKLIKTTPDVFVYSTDSLLEIWAAEY